MQTFHFSFFLAIGRNHVPENLAHAKNTDDDDDHHRLARRRLHPQNAGDRDLRRLRALQGQLADRTHLSAVIAGLDPAIHEAALHVKC